MREPKHPVMLGPVLNDIGELPSFDKAGQML